MLGFFAALRNIVNGVISVVVIIPLLLTAWIPSDPDTPVMVNANATNPYIKEYLDTDVSAHRSGAGIVPQNTLMAFEYVMKNNKELGVDTFEFDVQITADGELILLHNLTYDDTSNAVEFFGHKSVYASQVTFDEAYNNVISIAERNGLTDDALTGINDSFANLLNKGFMDNIKK